MRDVARNGETIGNTTSPTCGFVCLSDLRPDQVHRHSVSRPKWKSALKAIKHLEIPSLKSSCLHTHQVPIATLPTYNPTITHRLFQPNLNLNPNFNQSPSRCVSRSSQSWLSQPLALPLPALRREPSAAPSSKAPALQYVLSHNYKVFYRGMLNI